MTPALPPSSSTTFFLPARSFIRQPTDGEPVKVSSLKRSSATIRSPSSRVIGRIETEPAGTPAASMISATASITSGSLDGGLRTIGLPDAIAGASLCAARFSGKLNGLIAAIGPIGNRRVMPMRSLDDGSRSSGMSSPVIRSASSAPRRKVSVARSTSTRASRMGLPASSAISRPSSSRRALSPALISRRIRPRSYAGSLRVTSNAATAASTASSYCASVAWNVLPAGVVGSAGLATTRGSGDSTQRPARKMGCGLVPAAMAMVGILRAAGRRGAMVPRGSRARRTSGGTRHACRPSCDHRPMPDLRSRLLVEPGRKVRLEDFDTSATHGHDKADAAKTTAEQLVRLRTLQDRFWAEGEAVGAGRPPGDRRRRQGRHDQQGHGGLQPAGLPGHVVQGAQRRGARPRLPVAGPQGGPAQGRDRDLQPLALRGRAHRPRPRPRPQGGLVEALRRRSTPSSGISPTTGRRS